MRKGGGIGGGRGVDGRSRSISTARVGDRRLGWRKERAEEAAEGKRRMKEGGMVGQRGSEAEDEQSEIQNHKSGK